ncbi:sugar ABC transporter substrate-binding protein [Acaricomes phytoseiuli]|uniref:sugar ABC transporter substrate-binding protein n=1 Tax=Acaricomes phytoseiuli TaxID=291968 RepID=UPI000476826A|nr:maltose ABC transporter substrate-binding protein [Acaricomes phytoseiuli]
MRKTRVALGLGALISALALAGCASSETPVLLGGPGELTIWAGTQEVAGLQPTVDQFTADTGVKINLVQRDFSDQVVSDFITQAPTGQGPDIVLGAHDVLGQLVSNGILAPVELGQRQQEFAPVATTAATYDGRTYGVPFAIETIAVLRNDGLSQAAPQSFEELIAAGQEVVDAGRADYPLAIPQTPDGSDPYHLYPLQTSFGAEVFERDPDGQYIPQLAMGGPEGTAFAEYLAQLGQRGVLNTSLTTDVTKTLFLSGRTPFLVSGPWNLPDLRAAGMSMTVLPFPPAGPQLAQPFVGAQMAYVSAESSQPLAAQNFVANYLTRPEAQLAMFEATGRAPALQSAIAEIDDQIMSDYASIAETGVPMPAIPQMGAVWNFWGSTEAGIINQQGDPATLWRRMVGSIEGAIQ